MQGVGFRPFVYRLAVKHNLSGYVLNTSSHVELEIEGPPEALEAFLHDLTAETPVLAYLREVVADRRRSSGRAEFLYSCKPLFRPH